MIINIFCFNIVWVLIECLPVLFASGTELIYGSGCRSVLGIKGVVILQPLSVLQISDGTRWIRSRLPSMINLLGGLGLTLDPVI